MTDLEQVMQLDLMKYATTLNPAPMNSAVIDPPCVAAALIKAGWTRPITNDDQAELTDARLAGMIGPAQAD